VKRLVLPVKLVAPALESVLLSVLVLVRSPIRGLIANRSVSASRV
jgi:hypothetical protein